MRKFREMIFSGGNKGFTLIELLVVIAVLGILAGIAVPRLMGVRDQAIRGSLRADASTFRNAMEMYYALEGVYPPIDATGLADLSFTVDGDEIVNFSDDATSVFKSGTSTTTATSYSVVLADDQSNFQVTVNSSEGVLTVGEYQ